MPESTLFFIFSIICLYLAYRFDTSEGKFYFIVSSPTFIFLSIFPAYTHTLEFQELLVLENYTMGYKTWFWAVVLVISYPVAFLFSNVNVKLINYRPYYYAPQKLNTLFYTFSLLSCTALIVNLSNVNFNVNLLFTQPRAYEELFGKYWFVNYIYFLHIPALVLFVCKTRAGLFYKKDALIVLFLIFGSTLHGIKYTVFDLVFFPLIFYVVVGGFKRVRIYFYVSVIFFILFFAAFSYFVRGNYGEFDLFAIKKYILPNYLNLFYALEKDSIPFSFPYKAVLGFIPSFPIESNLEGGFLLNEKYNMSTGFKVLIETMSIFGALVFYSITLTLLKCLNRANIFQAFVMALILFSFLMMFYSYYIGSKFKYIFLIIVFYCIERYCRRKYSEK